MTLRFGLKARDIAVLSSEKIIQNINFVAVGAGLVNLYDFDRAQTLLREKGEGYVGMLLIALGTLFTLWALMLPRNEAHLLAVVVAFLAGIALALMLTKGGFYFWRRVGEPRLFDCAWLEWLEIQVPDPLDQPTTPPVRTSW